MCARLVAAIDWKSIAKKPIATIVAGKIMSNLIQVTPQQQDTHIIYVCNETNAPYANLAQLERMFPNVDSRTLRRRLDDAARELIKKAVIRSHTREYEVAVYPASVVSDLAFEFDLPLAKAMARAGAAVYMYGLAGYEIKPTPKTVEDDRLHLEKSIAPKPKLSEIKQATKMYELRYGKAYGDRYHDQMVSKHYPALKGDAPEREEKTSLPTSKCLLTPTDIAAKLKIFYKTGSPNPQVVNKLLAELGYQEKIEGQWSATDKAIAANLADRKPVDTNSKTQKDQLLWSADVIAILQEHTASSETNDSIDNLF